MNTQVIIFSLPICCDVTNDLDYKLLIDFIGLSQTNTLVEKVLNRANQY
jgi:hypothetical protein